MIAADSVYKVSIPTRKKVSRGIRLRRQVGQEKGKDNKRLEKEKERKKEDEDKNTIAYKGKRTASDSLPPLASTLPTTAFH